MPAGASVRAAVRRIPFSDLEGFSALFRDYCTRYDSLSDFYAGDYRAREVRLRAADRAAAVDRDRETVADVLLEQNEKWGLSDLTRSNIEALRDPNTVAVVTGQQVGLFTGPIYTILKTISTIQLAERLADESGRTVVPVFWLGGEDHDFQEISTALVFRRNEPHELKYSPPATPGNGNTGPVGRLVMDGQIDRLVEELDELLPPTDFKPDVMRSLRSSYTSGATFSDAFARFVVHLFEDTGLVLINSDDARLKELVRPLYAREIEEPLELSERVRETSAHLAERYHAQVQVRPTNLFYLAEEGRFALDYEDGAFKLRGRQESFSKTELETLLDTEPGRFSPNVVLRPLTQDLLLPTAVYVAGPGEAAYFAQYRQAYEWAGIPMPLIYPRASVTIAESKVVKVIEKYGLSLSDFGDDLDRLFQRVVLETMEVDVDAAFGSASRHLHEAVNSLKPPLEEIDRTLVKAAEATRQALMEEFDKLKAKVVRLEKKNQDVVRSQLEKVHVNMYPLGVMQERAVSIVYFVNKYGLGFIRELLEAVSLDTTEHQILEL